MPPSGKGPSNPYWTGAASGIDKLMRQGKDVDLNVGAASASFKTAMEKSTQAVIKSNKDAAQQGLQSMKGFYASVKKEQDRTFKAMIEDQNKLYKNLVTQHMKAQGFIQMTDGRYRQSGAGGLFNMFKGGFHQGRQGNPAKEMGETFEALGAKIGMLTRPLTVISGILGAVAAGIAIVVANTVKFEKQTRELRVGLGGTSKELQDFRNNISTLKSATGLWEEQVISLTQAFVDFGEPMKQLNGNVASYVSVAGKAVNLFGISDETAARYFRTLGYGGDTVSEMNSSLNETVKTMTRLGNTSRDAAESFTEAIQGYNEYGGALGLSIDSMQQGFQGARSVFKAMNMDATKAAASYGRLMSDFDDRRRQAALITRMSGGTYGGNLKKLMDPEEGTKMRMQNALQFMASNMGGMRDTLGKTDQELRSSLSDDDYAKYSANFDRAQKLTRMRFGNEMADGSLSAFRNSKNRRGDGLMEQIANFIPDKMALQQAGHQPKTLEQTMDGMTNTLSGMFDKLMKDVESFTTDISAMVTTHLPAVISLVKSIYDGLKAQFKWKDAAMAMGAAVSGNHSGLGSITGKRDSNILARGVGNVITLGDKHLIKSKAPRFGAAGAALTKPGMDGDWGDFDALFGSGGATTAGAMPTGGMSSAKINEVLKKRGSPMSGMGDFIAQASAKAGVDPALVMSIMQHDSGFGTAGVGAKTMNPGNQRPGSKWTGEVYNSGKNGKFRKYGSWQAGIQGTIDTLARYQKQGLTTPEQIVHKYAPGSDNNNEAAYVASIKSNMKKWKGGASNGTAVAMKGLPPPPPGVNAQLSTLVDHGGLSGKPGQNHYVPAPKVAGSSVMPGAVKLNAPPPPVALDQNALKELQKLTMLQQQQLDAMKADTATRDKHMNQIKQAARANDPASLKHAEHAIKAVG